MANTRQLREIFDVCFDEPRRWTNWFFSSIARDDDVVTVEADGKTVSGALMQRYSSAYAGATLTSAYISCVGTLPQARGHGHATALLAGCLRRARSAGTALAELIPAEPHLFDYYRRSAGFATVFYVESLHYTAIHRFDECGEVVEPTFELLHDLELRHGCGVLHSADDFKYILTDLSLDKGSFMTAACNGAGSAIAVAVDTDGNAATPVCVRALLADNTEAAETVLADVRKRVGKRSLTVWAPPSRSAAATGLRPRAMLRIVDADAVLGALAAANPSLCFSIVLHDPILPENSGVYRLRDGVCTRDDERPRRPDLEADITTLTAILFSAPATGDIFGLPTRRPYISLMLD
ncbi:MAG: GNAT family N-acetyltransferase [Muribaculaceae bacterium]|nr:GNAT family N-acetyltransferase [Muribaculaceae bacterium]